MQLNDIIKTLLKFLEWKPCTLLQADPDLNSSIMASILTVLASFDACIDI